VGESFGYRGLRTIWDSLEPGASSFEVDQHAGGENDGDAAFALFIEAELGVCLSVGQPTVRQDDMQVPNVGRVPRRIALRWCSADARLRERARPLPPCSPDGLVALTPLSRREGGRMPGRASGPRR
jgi:hypothetical protein